MKKPTVTVVISTFNRAHFIAQTIDSFLHQTHRPSQIIVINDGSTDETQAILDLYSDNILYLEQNNSGKAAALNKAFKYVEGEYIWIFDDDDVVFNDALERHLVAFAQNPDIDFTYSSYCKGYSGENNELIPGVDVKTPNIDVENFFLEFLDTCFVVQQSMLVKFKAIKEIGPYDESLIRSQDYDFLIRLFRHHKGMMISGPTFYRRYHNGQRGGGNDLFKESEIESKWYEYEKKIIIKHMKSLQLIDFLPRNKRHTQAHSDLQQARLRKASILSIKGLWHEASQAFESLGVTTDTTLSSKEKQICHAAMKSVLALKELVNSRQLIKQYSHSVSKLNFLIRKEISKGIYYNLLKNRQEYNYIQLIKLSTLTFKLLIISKKINNATLPI